MTAESLKAAREAEGLTQAEVAAALGVSHRTYQYWEVNGPPAWVARRAATMVHRLLDAAEETP
jgi:transcriptional regulator with XRE-family HTH domain